MEVGEDFINQPLLQKMIANNVEEINSKLENFEQIKQYTIIPRRFTEERMSWPPPPRKLKKRVIMEHYAEEIEELYQRKKTIRKNWHKEKAGGGHAPAFAGQNLHFYYHWTLLKKSRALFAV